jgi:hypothetical protein
VPYPTSVIAPSLYIPTSLFFHTTSNTPYLCNTPTLVKMATEEKKLLWKAVSKYTAHRALFPPNDELDRVYMGQDSQDSEETDESDEFTPSTTPETAGSVPDHELAHEIEHEYEGEMETSMKLSHTMVPRRKGLVMTIWDGHIAEDTHRLDIGEERNAIETTRTLLVLRRGAKLCTCGDGCWYSRNVPVLRGRHDFARWERDLLDAARRVDANDLLAPDYVRPEMELPEAGGSNLCGSNLSYNHWVRARLRFEKQNKSLLAGIKKTIPPHMASFLSGIEHAREAYAKVLLFYGPHDGIIRSFYWQASEMKKMPVKAYNRFFRNFNQHRFQFYNAGVGSIYTPELVRFLYLEHFDESHFLARCKEAMYEEYQIASTGSGCRIDLDGIMDLAEETEQLEMDWVLWTLNRHLRAPRTPGPSVQQPQQPVVVNHANLPHPAGVRPLNPRAPSFQSALASTTTPTVFNTPEPVGLRPMPPRNRLRSNGGGRYVVPQRRHDAWPDDVTRLLWLQSLRASSWNHGEASDD